MSCGAYTPYSGRNQCMHLSVRNARSLMKQRLSPTEPTHTFSLCLATSLALATILECVMDEARAEDSIHSRRDLV
jgi:hypothetical protein